MKNNQKKILTILISTFIVIILVTCRKDNNEELFGFFTDSRDGNTYKTVKIGNQIWMAENLNYNLDDGDWEYDSSYSAIYGCLYDWETACDVCPMDWHLPSDEEWKKLEMYLGMNESEADTTGFRGTDESSKLKAIDGWESQGNGTNESGFSALPAGGCTEDGLLHELHRESVFWSSTEFERNWSAWIRRLRYERDDIYRDGAREGCGFSVRCVKN